MLTVQGTALSGNASKEFKFGVAKVFATDTEALDEVIHSIDSALMRS